MDGMTWVIFGLVAVCAVAAVVAALFAAQAGRGGRDVGADMAEATRYLSSAQAELAGRMAQMAEAQAASHNRLAERLHIQERTVSRVLEERLADMSRRVGEGLQVTTEKTFAHMNDLRERLAVIDAAQKNIQDLSSQIIGLQDILSNKQARGAFGEVQLNDLVTAALPPSAYSFQAVLGNGKRADCLLTLPNPPGSIVVDAKFPLESYHALRNARDDAARVQASRAFANDVLRHVRDIAEKYIIAGETAESALMFLPSEAVYAELHASFPEVVDKSYRARVWIVSPTTLMATLNTVRAVLKDARMQEQAGIIQAEVGKLLEDVGRLDTRVGKLAGHFAQVQEDIRQVQISTGRITKRAERMEDLQIGDAAPPVAAPPADMPGLGHRGDAPGGRPSLPVE